MNIADLVLSNLYMRDNEKSSTPSCPLALAWVILYFEHLKVPEPMILKDKKSITTLK
jgi:hypothetical protein